MPRQINGFTIPLRFCDEDCNHCDIHINRQFSLLVNILHEKFGEEVYHVTQSVCPNMTCCADCRIDDFCHDEDCEIANEAEALAKAWYTPTAPARNCDRFCDEQDAQLAFLNEERLISVEKDSMLERDRFENWTDEMRSAYAHWLMAVSRVEGDAE